MAYKIVKSYVSALKYVLKCPYSMKPIGITVHNTANDASAKNEVSYMKNNNSSTSYHVAIDDKEVILAVPFNRNAWHAGDGNKGTGNRKTIGIEICYSKTGGTRFNNAEENAAKYIATLLKEYGWTVKDVYKHQNWSGKNCPHRTISKGWERFVDMIQGELDILNKKNVEEEKKSTASSTTTSKNKIDTIKEVQSWVNKEYTFADISVDGAYGKNTKKALIKALQTELNQNYKKSLKVDGVWGTKTKSAIKTLTKGTKNDVVAVLQAFLVCNGYTKAYVDGNYGADTYNAVKSYQSKKGLSADGKAGKNTFVKLCG